MSKPEYAQLQADDYAPGGDKSEYMTPASRVYLEPVGAVRLGLGLELGLGLGLVLGLLEMERKEGDWNLQVNDAPVSDSRCFTHTLFQYLTRLVPHSPPSLPLLHTPLLFGTHPVPHSLSLTTLLHSRHAPHSPCSTSTLPLFLARLVTALTLWFYFLSHLTEGCRRKQRRW